MIPAIKKEETKNLVELARLFTINQQRKPEDYNDYKRWL